MQLGPDAEQRELVDSFARLLAKASSPEQVRATEPGGFDAGLWRELLATGALTMAVSEAAGGWGASLVDLALVAEQLGRAAAPAPVLEAQVAARLLAAVGTDAALDALAPVLAGDRLATIAVSPPVGGVAALTPAGAVCDAVLVLDADRLVLVPVSDSDRRPVANLASAPLADVDVGGRGTELVAGGDAVAHFEAALDEWLTLTAAALVGIGGAALDLGCAYAAERVAFGARIGTFQGVAHPLADDATGLDGAQLLARKAAWSLDTGERRGRELAAMAFAFASGAAARATYDAVHVHGGYGFMLEHDVQLFYRRARGWPRAWADPDTALRRAATARYTPDAFTGHDIRVERTHRGGGRGMDFSWGADAEAFRGEVRGFLAEHLPPALEDHLYATGTAHDPAFVRALGARNWIAPEWPRDGFDVLGPEAVHVLEEELTRADAPIYASTTSVMVTRVIREVGSEELQAEIVPKVVRGEVTIALGMSEPEAGSDVAAVQTRARPVDGGWVIDGQKMFTTNAHVADYVFLLTRTDPASERHRGLTMFLVPLDRDGIEVQAVFTLSGERTNITFYGGVFVEDRWRISPVDAGWQALMLALQDEHSAPFSPHLLRLLDHAEHWAATPTGGEGGEVPLDRDPVRDRLIRAATDLEVARLLEQRTTWMESNGEVPVAEGPMSKLFSTEAIVRHAEAITAVVGPDALRSRGEPTAVGAGRIEHALRFSLGTTIYGGTSEIQRNIVAQRRCGLPRS